MAEMQKYGGSFLRINTEQFHFIWKFVGFNKIPFIPEHPILSPSFALKDESETLWQLQMAKQMQIKSKTKEDTCSSPQTGVIEDVAGTHDTNPEEKAVGFKMLKADSEEEAVGFKALKPDPEECFTWDTIKYYVQIKNGETTFKTETKIESGEKHFTTDAFHYIFSSDLNGVPLFEEETITIEAFIEYKHMDTRPLIPADMVNRERFTENLTRLFMGQKYTDVILKAGDCEIAAHKCILCTRTYGLERHLPDGAGIRKQKLNLDLDESVAEALVTYAYCGRIPEDFPVAKCPALYAAAEKYEVQELKTFVRDHFMNNMSSAFCVSCILESESVSEMLLKLPGDVLKATSCKKNFHKPQE